MCNVHMRMCVYIGYMWYTGVVHMYTASIVICVVHCSGIFLSLFQCIAVLIAVLVYNAV